MVEALLMACAFFGALMVTFLLTPLLAAYATKIDLVDRPGTRKIHKKPIPRIGGVAVFFGLVAGAVAYTAMFGVEKLLQLVVKEGHLALLVPCAMVFIMGLVDDVRGTTPLVKVVVQSAASIICIQAGYVINEIWTPFGFSLPLGLLSYPLTLLWFIGVTNAFNLIDGLDGLLASVGIASLLGCFVVAISVHMTGVAYFPLALAGALSGFLYWNWHRARVFIGDSGSLLVGFVVAALALKVSRYSESASTQGVALHVMLALTAIPAAETFLSLLRRHVSGQPYFSGDASHMHHVLIQHKKLTIRKTVLVLAAVQVLFSGIAVASRMRLGWGALVPASMLLLVAVAGIWWLGYVEFRVLARRAYHLLTNRARREIADAVRVARAGELIRHVDRPDDLVAALREAVEIGRFVFIAIEFTDEGREAVHDEMPPLEVRCGIAENYAASLSGKKAWLFSSNTHAGDVCNQDQTGRADGERFHGSIRYSVPLPAEDGRFGVLVCERGFDHRGRAPSAYDIKAYVGVSVENALAQIVARDTKLVLLDSGSAPQTNGGATA